MTNRSVWWAAAAFAVVAFGAGLGVGSRQTPGGGIVDPKSPSATATAAGEKFALFLFEDASYRSPADDRILERVEEYSGWAQGLAESGRYVTGEKLADDGRACRVENGALAASEPGNDPARGRLTGYFVIGAKDLDEALQVVRTCPHLKYGGSVEVRRLETT